MQPRSAEPEILDRTPVSQDSAIAQRVQEVRSRLYPIITAPNGSVGTLRVLGVNRPVLVDSQIYIDLNVLERLSCEWYFSQWQQEYEPGDRELFDRVGVGRVERPRVEAISMVISDLAPFAISLFRQGLDDNFKAKLSSNVSITPNLVA